MTEGLISSNQYEVSRLASHFAIYTDLSIAFCFNIVRLFALHPRCYVISFTSVLPVFSILFWSINVRVKSSFEIEVAIFFIR